MLICVTGAAGFIGSAVALRLLQRGDKIIGIDNMNAYYDPALKHARLALLKKHQNYAHLDADVAHRDVMQDFFSRHTCDVVVHMAAQAGVRYSIENPYSYIDSNLVGFAHILEGCRATKVGHLVYASSSSVYGANAHMPYSVHDAVDHPLSLYAATKKANEAMAHSYSHLYEIPTTALRFFTVYGPWGRPDMALFSFTRAMLNQQPINVYNHGAHSRDFTYIDDVVEGVVRVIDRPATSSSSWDPLAPDPATSVAPWCIYNIGNNQPVKLLDFIHALESCLNTKAQLNYLPMQAGDVPDTWADVSDLRDDFGYEPKTSVQDGVAQFVNWYRSYYKM